MKQDDIIAVTEPGEHIPKFIGICDMQLQSDGFPSKEEAHGALVAIAEEFVEIARKHGFVLAGEVALAERDDSMPQIALAPDARNLQ